MRTDLDCLGDMCPLPVLKIDRAFQGMEVGDSVVVVIDHSCVLTSLEDKYKAPTFTVDVDEVMTGVWEVTITKIR